MGFVWLSNETNQTGHIQVKPSGSKEECWTQDHGVVGSSLTGIRLTMTLTLSKTLILA